MHIPTNPNAHHNPEAEGYANIDANLSTGTVMLDYQGAGDRKAFSNIPPLQALDIADALRKSAEKVIAARKTTITVELPAAQAISLKNVVNRHFPRAKVSD